MDQDSLGGPDDEKADDEAAYDVNEKRSVGENWSEASGCDTAQQISKICPDDGGHRDGEKVL